MRRSLEELCAKVAAETEASLVAIAEFHLPSEGIRWTYADRPLNERYKRMSVIYGRGVAGRVLQTGTSFRCENVEDLPLPIREYPIVLSEKIRSFIGIPIANSSLFGAVLFIGYRTSHALPDKDLCDRLSFYFQAHFQKREAVE
ncbi:GAF domain-containing protein [Halobacillus sp. Nhm2S1]|uniref:GAF domain-containing protein n=1 Tax=Halobacillus sp. Nhm2S1 TaxID=2866716 RepID=UPI001C734652|nr:GAF domain-containing protein [Halobacillus sp. Nhm2S1]MBX0358145.1 GAF domain-containing protein [Halobacillus sp. Nhm2S1]